ncbi:MAG TPA: hypothetical protein VFH97_08705 [Gemmatimonadales bacterium]|nr:hypothetical protein [Gemmatimonadales bacterium]
MSHKVVAHFIDHAIVKGMSVDVDPARPLCHIHTTDGGTVEVDLSQVKALYFVKEFDGRPRYDEAHEAHTGDQRLRGSRLVRIRFQDGEEQGGLMNRYPPNRPFFFLLPMDPQSNNIRILVNRDAVAELRPVDDQPDSVDAQPKPAGDAPRPQRTSWVFDGKDIRPIKID